jgi:hypothetical protein
LTFRETITSSFSSKNDILKHNYILLDIIIQFHHIDGFEKILYKILDQGQFLSEKVLISITYKLGFLNFGLFVIPSNYNDNIFLGASQLKNEIIDIIIFDLPSRRHLFRHGSGGRKVSTLESNLMASRKPLFKEIK